jgi:hypothetical protein
MNGLFDAALEVQQFMQARDWPFCMIGGIAVLRWGEVRMTQDVDLNLLTGFGGEEPYIRALMQTFRGRIPNADSFALQYRVLLLSASNGVDLDITLGALPFEYTMIERATPYTYAPNCELLTCSAEDLIVLKAFADREKDWVDVEGILFRQGAQLEMSYIFDHLILLCDLKGKPEIVANLRQRLRAVEHDAL